MQIYHYHPDTGAYLGDGLADESPLEPGVWLIPAHATTVAPPEHGEGQQAVMVDGTWQVRQIPESEPMAERLSVSETLPEPTDLTPQQKLARAGLTVEELKELLGL